MQKQREQHQHRQRQQDFFDPFGRRRPQAPPIFSVTMSLTPDNYRDLVEDSDTSWLLQFYHDHSEQCKEFAQRWEALAHKLSPMVKLGRVRIDDNFGLVQRYRSFLRCRQSAFFLQCDAPALILATTSADGETRAEGYRGGLNAEQVYEWVKRSFTDTRRVVSAVAASDAGLQAFLRPAPRRGREPPELGLVPPRAIFFTSRAAADSLLARFIASSFKESLTFGSVQVEGGLQTGSEAARLASACGVTELPAVAVWADGARTSQPTVHLIGSSPDTRQRKALIAAIERSAVPSVPLLAASNLHTLCAPGAWDEDFAFCVLLLMPKLSAWDQEAKRAFTTLQALKTGGGGTGRARYAWVDAQRQRPFATFLREAAPAVARQQQPPLGVEEAKRPAIFALRGHEGGAGLRRVRVARYGGALTEVTQQALRAWLESLQENRNWRAAKTPPPPLRASARPNWNVRFYAWAVNGGWLVILLLVGGGAAVAWYWPAIKRALDEQAGRTQPQHKPPRHAQREASSPGKESEPSQQRNNNGATPSPPEPTRRASEANALPRLSAGIAAPTITAALSAPRSCNVRTPTPTSCCCLCRQPRRADADALPPCVRPKRGHCRQRLDADPRLAFCGALQR